MSENPAAVIMGAIAEGLAGRVIAEALKPTPLGAQLESQFRIGRFVLAIEQLAKFPVSSPKSKPAPAHRRSRGGQYTRD